MCHFFDIHRWHGHCDRREARGENRRAREIGCFEPHDVGKLRAHLFGITLCDRREHLRSIAIDIQTWERDSPNVITRKQILDAAMLMIVLPILVLMVLAVKLHMATPRPRPAVRRFPWPPYMTRPIGRHDVEDRR